MSATTTSYAIGRSVPLAYEQAVARIRDTLQQQGFGVLTEIDVRATLKKKLDVDFKKYVILGACNPPLAYAAIEADPQVGLLLPCNVTVEATGPTTSTVRLTDPELLLAASAAAGSPALGQIARDAGARLARVVAALRQVP